MPLMLIVQLNSIKCALSPMEPIWATKLWQETCKGRTLIFRMQTWGIICDRTLPNRPPVISSTIIKIIKIIYIIYDNLWSSMIIYDHLWSSMIIYDHLWSSMIIYDHLCSSMFIYVHLFISIECIESLVKTGVLAAPRHRHSRPLPSSRSPWTWRRLVISPNTLI